MNLSFRESVWKAQFKPTAQAAEIEEELMRRLGLSKRYEAAQLMLGRSLVERTSPAPTASGAKFGKPIPGENLFGDQLDAWLAIFIIDAGLGVDATVENLRSVVEAHWERGATLLSNDWEHSNADLILFARRMAELIPARARFAGAASTGRPGAIELRVGSVSQTFPDEQPVSFVINGPGTSPHIALMGRSGSGKTTTGTQIAAQIVGQAAIPILFIDPKGEFVDDGKLVGPFAKLPGVRGLEVGVQPIPLDFSPSRSAGKVEMQSSARQLAESVLKCCRTPGDLQRARIVRVIESAFELGRGRDLASIANDYESALHGDGKDPDSILALLRNLTDFGAGCFQPDNGIDAFFGQSWVISLKKLPDDLRKLVVLILLDAVKTYFRSLKESPVEGGFRVLKGLIVIDEARRFLRETRSESLVEIVREMRSKGACVMLLSQDPSDFEGEQDDFTTQLGTVIGFSCNQSRSGLRALRGVFGRALQEREFSDAYLPPGVAFCKLPGRAPERITCWSPNAP